MGLALHLQAMAQAPAAAPAAPNAAVGAPAPRATATPATPPAAPAPATPAPAPASGGVTGLGFGESLKATRPARARAPATIENRPYAPISRPDDEGQIPEIEMFVGESRVFPTPGVARIAVGNGGLLTAAALDGKEVILFANGPGTSSLFIWNADGRYQRLKINIVAGDTSRHAREIASFLTTIPRAKATVVGSNVILEGEDLSDEDLFKLEALVARYPQIVNFTNRVGWEKMVTMDVKVVEFPINLLREMGLKWSSTGGAAIAGIWAPAQRGSGGPYEVNIITPTGSPVPITGSGGGPARIPSGLNAIAFMNLGLNAQLNLLAQEGQATILAEPQLTTRNGAPAKFVAGGELPYGVSSVDGTRIIFKEYGIKLDITPRVSSSGVIRSIISAEVSSVDSSVSTAFGPALLKRQTSTEFNLREGETMVLAGLLQRDTSTSIDKVPVLGDIPVLGALFRSKRFQNKETELVIFVTPRLVTAQSAGNVDRIQRATERLGQRLGEPPHLSQPLQPGVSYARPDDLPGAPAAAPSAPMAPTPARPADDAAAMVPGGSRLIVTADATVLRSHPAQDSAALLQLHRGATVRLGDADPYPAGSGAWRNVVVGAVNGWVPNGAVRPMGSGAAANTVPPVVAQQAQSGVPVARPLSAAPPAAQVPDAAQTNASARTHRVTLNGLALRVTPDINAPILMNLREGTLVSAQPSASRGAWTPVQVGEGAARRSGWVASQWVQPLAAP